jgi:hypothetical protein
VKCSVYEFGKRANKQPVSINEQSLKLDKLNIIYIYIINKIKCLSKTDMCNIFFEELYFKIGMNNHT